MWLFTSNEFENPKRFYGDEDSQNYFNTNKEVMAFELFKYANSLPKGNKKTKLKILIFTYFVSLIVSVLCSFIHFFLL